MADVITRFKLETTQYDSALRDASKGLAAYSKQAELAGKDFDKFTKGGVEAARALGSISTSATNTKEKVKELVSAYNDVAKAYNKLTEDQKQSDFGKAMAQSLQQLQGRIKETKNELYSLGDATKNAGGGLFGGISDKMSGAIQVFAGNMLTKAAGAVAELGSEIFASVQQGIELARQGEGIRNAFERLGRGDILDGLREATHGTVTDIELMKAAVKFNDFKLPIEELGTMLAFAQQKAKDTGQSVDYMVDSIVTGLGRKSLIILDNLGLSATEVKDKMKETGDMTKAVGAIIREQMAKAGDYMETAADRAAQANVNLQNKMEELGRKFGPVEEASTQLWTSMKIAILDVVGGPLARLLNGLTEAGRLKNMLNDMNGESGSGNTKVDQQLKKLNVIKKAGGSDYIFNSTLNGMTEDYNRQIMALDAQIKNGGKRPGAGSGESQDVRYLQRKIDALKIMRDQLAAGAKEINKPIKIESNIPDETGGGSGKGGRTTTHKTTPEYIPLEGSIDAQTKKVQELQKAWRSAADDDSRRRIKEEIDEQQYALDLMTGKIKQRPKMDAVDVGVGIAPSSATDPFANMKDNLPAVISPLKQLEDHLKELIKLQEEFGGMSESAWQIYQKEIENTKGQIDNFKNGGNDVTKGGKDIAKSWRTAASAISTVGSAMSGLKNPAIDIMTVIGQSIATIALSYAENLAGDKTTKGNIWAFIAAAAAATVSMATTIASIHSSTGYAQGGIVKGNSYSGDNVPALVDGSQMVGLNAGEVVLTAAMTNNLANGIQNRGFGNMNIVGVLEGEKIKLVLNRHLKRTGQGELVTWR